MAYYGGEEQRKKDEKKAAYEKQLKKMLPKRAFDQMGREIDPRSGKLKESLRSSLLTDKKFMKKVKDEKKGKKRFGVFSKDAEAAKKRTNYTVDKKTPYSVHKNTRYY